MHKYLIIIIIVLCFISCKQSIDAKEIIAIKKTSNVTILEQEILEVSKPIDTFYYSKSTILNFKEDDFVRLNKLDSTFSYDMRYATSNNFLKQKVYDCEDCLVRYSTAKQLIVVNNEFKKLGYSIQFFDCYRPLDIQKRMWEIYPDNRYVADPVKGSNHNRGAAVDITLIDSLKFKLDMGTDFDFFGKKAHHLFQDLPDDVLENRRLLKEIMEQNGFMSITSEWWHYNLKVSKKYDVSNFKVKCNN